MLIWLTAIVSLVTTNACRYNIQRQQTSRPLLKTQSLPREPISSCCGISIYSCRKAQCWLINKYLFTLLFEYAYVTNTSRVSQLKWSRVKSHCTEMIKLTLELLFIASCCKISLSYALLLYSQLNWLCGIFIRCILYPDIQFYPLNGVYCLLYHWYCLWCYGVSDCISNVI